ncbi:Pupal cuticle protein C1B [Pseudolycoriella hygida]|uniref:Pupal cuticle protein C1B n=1 Tax=Pseudolycoriella hygida TaxID=35572 RepID=A0A9Q0NBP3_9DIPT|nr:Pupal cuticle protein C1B [Pseudolycoriella hygida]
MFIYAILLAAVAVANSQYVAPAITTQNQNIYRSFGNLGQVSTYSKSIDTPFSSVSKSDVRVSNPGYAVSAHGYAAPIAHGYAAPIAHGYAAPIAHGYASPIAHGYAAPLAHAGYAAPIAKVGVATGLLGVAYSASPAVAHMTYSNGLGINYAW